MKKFLVSSFILLMCAAGVQAQCDKNATAHSSKQELMNLGGDVEATDNDNLSAEITKDKITITIEGKDGALTANVKEVDCQWKKTFQEGKATYKVEFIEPNKGESFEGTLTLEIKDDKLVMIVTMAKMDGKLIRVWFDKVEEK